MPFICSQKESGMRQAGGWLALVCGAFALAGGERGGAGRSAGYFSSGLRHLSHLGAGRPQRWRISSARAASASRVGRVGVCSASTTVLPSRVGLKAQRARAPKASPMRARLRV